MWTQMSMTLNQVMVKAHCILLTDVSCRILKEPKKINILRILMLLIKGYKFPLVILTWVKRNDPFKLVIVMLLTQKENWKHYP